MRAAPGEHLRRTIPLFAAAAALACSAAGDGARRADTAADTPAVAAARFDSATVTILDTLHGRDVVSQCSRPSPGPVTSYWVPTPAQVAEADAAVLRALAAVVMDTTGAQVDTGVRRYHRQYVGLVRGGDRLLYVNGIASEAIAALRDTAVWRTFGQVACDGGSAFFGAEYDPATRRVSALHFNGPG